MKPIIPWIEHALEVVWNHRKAVRIVLEGSLLILAIAFLLRKYPAWRVSASIVGSSIFLIVLLWKFPKFQTASLKDLKPEERFDRENEARKTFSQIVGGLVLLIGFYFTWQVLISQNRIKLTARLLSRKTRRRPRRI